MTRTESRLRRPPARAWVWGAATLVMAGAVVAAVDGGGESAGSRFGHTVAESPLSASAATGGGAPSLAESGDRALVGDAAAAAAPDAPGTDVIRTAEVGIEVERGAFDESFGAATRVASELGGFVASSTRATADEGAGTGSLSIRVPSERFEEALTRLEGIGVVVHEERRGEEVSGQLVDLAARIRSLASEEIALREILSKAGSIGDALQVRERLAAVRTDIERLSAEESRLRDHVAHATISLSLREDGVAAPSAGGDGLADRAREAVDAALAVVGGMLLVAGYLAPLAALAAVAWVGWLVWRRRANRPAAPAAVNP